MLWQDHKACAFPTIVQRQPRQEGSLACLSDKFDDMAEAAAVNPEKHRKIRGLGEMGREYD